MQFAGKHSTATAPRVVVPHRPIAHIFQLGTIIQLLKKFSLGIIISLGIVVAVQLVYPAHRSLPGIQFGGYDLGNKSREEITGLLSVIDQKVFVARTVSRQYKQSLADIGVNLDVAGISARLSDYPLSQRLIPFSFLMFKPQAPDNHFSVVDDTTLTQFAERIAAENNTLPVEGTITNDQGELIVQAPVLGRNYSRELIERYFRAYTNETLADEATLPFESVSPANTMLYLEGVATMADELARKPHTVMHGQTAYKVDTSAIARSIRFVPDQAGKLQMDFDAATLASGLEEAADGVFSVPDAVELDRQASAEALMTALKGGGQAVVVTKPLVGSGPFYPATSKGIQRLIEDWQQANTSVDPVVAFSEIQGYGRRAGIGADERYFSASVYKVFPAWYALDQIDQGKLNPDGVIAAGMKLDACFYDAIIISQSNCSEAIVQKYGGWSVLDEFIRSHGIEGITLSNGVTITANGMVSFLTKLEKGELLSPERTQYLLGAMKRQKYRTGFASSDFAVANKVGYQPKTKSWHDTAIMYHPKGSYVLVALTKQGSTLPRLATLSRQINDTLSR